MKKPYSHVLISLLKGVVYSQNETLWEELLKNENDIKRYFSDIMLSVVIDRSEGFAFLKQQELEEEDSNLPKLIDKRQLPFGVSLLCLLLRRHLLENDSTGESTRVTLKKEAILEMMKPFFKESSNEAKQIGQIEIAIRKVVDEGFLRKMKNEEDLFEINRIIKAYINAEAVKESLEKLKSYANQTTTLAE